MLCGIGLDRGTISEKFKSLILNYKSINSQKPKNRLVADIIPLDIYNIIAVDIEKFESQNEFLQPVSLVELAKRLGANSTYLSKFIRSILKATLVNMSIN